VDPRGNRVGDQCSSHQAGQLNEPAQASNTAGSWKVVKSFWAGGCMNIVIARGISDRGQFTILLRTPSGPVFPCAMHRLNSNQAIGDNRIQNTRPCVISSKGT
jgi:hypothetical protein